MAVNLSPVGGVAAQFFTNTGAVLTGGKLFTYAAGTTTPVAAYTSSNGSTAWTNPIVLDAAGRVSGSGEIWITDGVLYKFLLKDANDVLIATYDNISGINSNFISFVNQQEIVTATAGQTVFNLGISYQPGTNSLSVFVDGVNQYGPGAQYAYLETDSDTVTFVSGLHVGAEVKFTTSQLQNAGLADASQVTYNPPFTGSATTNVEAKLAQTISVLDFGADPTGTIDSSSAIQDAINALALAGGGALYLPEGVYKITSALLVPYGVSMYGDGGTASVISCLNCDCINFNSASYDGGSMFYADFGITSHAGTTGNWAAIVSLLPSGGTFGVDSRDGLYFHRLRIYDFNQAFIFTATWESHINECKIFRVNNPIYLGNYAMVIRVTDNNITYENGFATGTANRHGIELAGPVTEGPYIRGNQIFGFPRCVAITGVVTYALINDNDMFGSVYGVSIENAANNMLTIKNNYFEISANNAIGIYGAIQNAEPQDTIVIQSNNFITGTGNNTKGILLGNPAGQYVWNWRIRDNLFVGLKTVDIEAHNVQNLIIEGNRCSSTDPTNNITISGGSASYTANYVIHNKVAKGISVEPTDATAGRIIVRENLIAGAQTFGAVWATSGKIDGNTIGSTTPAAGSFTDLKAVNKAFSGYGSQSTNTGSNFELDYVLPDRSLHIVTCYLENSANVQYGPGMYIIVRQGTSTTVTTVTAFSGVTVTVTAGYKINFANATGFNGIIYASALKTLS